MCGTDIKCTCGCSRQSFRDRAAFDAVQKTAISLRDGVYEYLGYEIGQRPFHKVFTVYRSPQAVSELAGLLDGIPLTDDHVDLEAEPPEHKIVGSIASTELVSEVNETTDTTLAVKNKIDGDTSMLELLADGKRELSLGFSANIQPHDKYDFEQTEFEPHHLAALERGRCGTLCKFIDNQGVEPVKLSAEAKAAIKKFQDAKGDMSIAQIMQLVQDLPVILQDLSIDEVRKLAPTLAKLSETAKGSGAAPDSDPAPTEPATDSDPAPTEPVAVEDTGEGDDPATPANPGGGDDTDLSVEDAAKFADGKTLFTDAQAQTFADAAVVAHSATVEKARKFVDHSYDFTGKSTAQIQTDVLALAGKAFADAAKREVAFDLLEVGQNYKNFGDSGASQGFESIAETEL